MAVSENFRPTLLVGVGGTGSKIAEKIMAQAIENDASLGNWIRLLVLDTDANDLDKLESVEDRATYQFSRPETVYRLLERNSDAEGDWCYRRTDPEMSQVILGKSLIEGAGQIRILTRLALHDSFAPGNERNLLDEMERSISSLTVHDDAQRFGGSIHVLMLGSLAGATGSGSFNQVALAIKQAARNRDVHATVRGVFLLPDVYARSGALPTSQVPNVLANGYASLKELNAINVRAQLPQRKANFKFEYLPGHNLKDGSTPFEAMTFIDYENSEGGSMGRNLDAYIDMAARSGYLMVFSPLGATYGSVTINDVRQQLAAVANGSTNLYSGIGVAAVTYPKDSMRSFLGKRLVLENLKGDWTRLDDSFRDQIARYKKDYAAGQTGMEEPKKSDSFVQGLEQLAKEEPRIPFFRQSYDYLFPEIEDEKTLERKIKPRHKAYVDALMDYGERLFWDATDTKQVKERNPMDMSSLLESDSLVDTVRRQESALDRDFRVLEAALLQRPEDTYQNMQITADGIGVGEWAPHHFQHHIVDGSPHPVTVRAFLYYVQQELQERRDKLDPRDKKLRLFRLANGFRDEEEVQSTNNRPPVRSTPRIGDLATAAEEGGPLSGLLGRKRKAFAEEYVDYFNGSLTAMRKFADESVQAKVLDQALSEIAALIRVFEGLFTEIGDIVTTLGKEIEDELKPYDGETGFTGDAFVYANRACKEDAWQRLSENAFGLKLDTGVNQRLVHDVVKKHRNDKRDRKESSFSQIRALFWSSVVEGFGQKTVDSDFKSLFDMTVIEAMRRQFAVEDQEAARLAAEEGREPPRPLDADERMRNIVDRAAKQSQPYLSFTKPDSDGTPIKFWTLHPRCKEAVNDDALFSQMFRSTDGSRPIVEAEFSPYDLICMNLRVNVELTHLSKLAMAEEGSGSVHAVTEGRMSQAYQAMVARMLDRNRSSKAGAEITPHVDRTWHLPGVLPEIFVDLEDKFEGESTKGYVIARLHELIKLERDGVPIAHFSTAGFGLRNAFDEELVDSHDPWSIYTSFTGNTPFVRGAIDFWDHVKGKGTGGVRSHASFKALTDPERLLALVMPSVVRNRDADARDEAVQSCFQTWIELISELVGEQEAGLTNRRRRLETQEYIDKARADLRELMREEEFEDAQVRVIEGLVAKAYDEVFGA